MVQEIDINNYTIRFDSNLFDDEREMFNPGLFDAAYTTAPQFRGTQYTIAIFLANNLLKRVLIQSSGGSTAIHKTSFVIEPYRLVICCSDTVFCLSIPDLQLLWKTKADDATCFQVFKHQSDYIVHGEMAISMLSHDGELVWEQSGADIFVTMHSSAEDFVITDNYILVTDFENRKYKFDFNGNSIY